MFEFEGKCFIKHIQSSRAVSADAKGKARIKINVPDLSIESAAGALLCKPEHVEGGFFEPGTDEEGLRPIMHGISKLVGAECWEGMHEVKISSLKKVDAAQLKVLSLKPKVGGTFDTMLLLVVEEPSENFLEILTDRCNRELNLKIKQVQADIVDEIEKTKEDQAAGEMEPARARKQRSRMKREELN